MPDLSAWLPDLPPYNHGGLVIARNVYASPIGYKPIKSLSAVTAALPYAWKGGGSFIDVDNTTVTLAGTNSGLYAYISGAWVSKYAGTYTANWNFAQFGSNVIGANGGAPVKYTIGTATGALLGGTPPSATMVAIVRDFVFLAGDPSNRSTVYWSAINNAEGWTIGTNQSDKQQLPDGGPITGIAGGEYGLVFQDSAVHRFSYVGSPVIFQRDKISSGVGSVTPGSVCQFGRMVFFLSGRGFYSILDGEPVPIGTNKVNTTFWNTYSRSDVQTYMRATVDPKRSLAIWSMPDRLWIYNWDLDRWTDVLIPGIAGLSTGVNATVSLEQVDTLYPSGLDSVPYSLDDPIFQGGDPLLTLVKSDNIIYSFGSSSNLEATLQYARTQFVPGRNSRVRRARVDCDATGGITLSLSYSGRLGDTQTTASTTNLLASGYMPIRATGQFMQPQIYIAAGTTWSYVTGVTFDFDAGGNG